MRAFPTTKSNRQAAFTMVELSVVIVCVVVLLVLMFYQQWRRIAEKAHAFIA